MSALRRGNVITSFLLEMKARARGKGKEKKGEDETVKCYYELLRDVGERYYADTAETLPLCPRRPCLARAKPVIYTRTHAAVSNTALARAERNVITEMAVLREAARSCNSRADRASGMIGRDKTRGGHERIPRKNNSN